MRCRNNLIRRHLATRRLTKNGARKCLWIMASGKNNYFKLKWRRKFPVFFCFSCIWISWLSHYWWCFSCNHIISFFAIVLVNAGKNQTGILRIFAKLKSNKLSYALAWIFFTEWIVKIKSLKKRVWRKVNSIWSKLKDSCSFCLLFHRHQKFHHFNLFIRLSLLDSVYVIFLNHVMIARVGVILTQRLTPKCFLFALKCEEGTSDKDKRCSNQNLLNKYHRQDGVALSNKIICYHGRPSLKKRMFRQQIYICIKVWTLIPKK